MIIVITPCPKVNFKEVSLGQNERGRSPLALWGAL